MEGIVTSSEYLHKTIKDYDNNNTLTYNERSIYNEVCTIVNNWFNYTYKNYYGCNSAYSIYNNFSTATLEIQQSGSRAKGTAIKGSSDLDMFLSITDRENEDTLKEYYNGLYDYLKRNGYNVRKQNVSIGLKYKGMEIDLVPAKKCNSQSYQRLYERFNDHYLWSNKKQARTLTNIQKHIDLIRNSNARNEIMLTKIWRNRFNLDFPSIYIELMIIDALRNFNEYDIGKRFLHVLYYIRDNIMDKKIVDPSNGQNIISDTLSYSEKLAIKNKANEAINARYWSEVV